MRGMNDQELKELEEQSDTVVENFKYIEENHPGDLETLVQQSGTVVDNFKYIEENHPGDLDHLEKQTGNIAGNLKAITDDQTSLDEYEAQLDRILEKKRRALED
jgi:hypothetical protein